MSEGVNPMPLGQKSVVVEISNSFAAVELIGGVLDVASQCSELLLFLLSQLHVRLLLQIVEHACEKIHRHLVKHRTEPSFPQTG